MEKPVSCENAEQLEVILEEYANNNGVALTSDKRKRNIILNGLLKSREKFGETYCPCRVKKVPENICPCDKMSEDVENQGMCHCNLFVRKE